MLAVTAVGTEIAGPAVAPPALPAVIGMYRVWTARGADRHARGVIRVAHGDVDFACPDETRHQARLHGREKHVADVSFSGYLPAGSRTGDSSVQRPLSRRKAQAGNTRCW